MDIGTGGGVIAFILASRNPNSVITGIDISSAAINEAQYNSSINPQFQDVNFLKISYQEIVKSHQNKYHLIVSNPPFFSTAMPSQDEDLARAKHTSDLDLDYILQTASGLLTKDGHLSVISNFRDLEELERTASRCNLYLSRICEVSAKPAQLPNRLLLEFKKEKSHNVERSKLNIRETDGDYNLAYKKLTDNLYLNF